MFNQSCWRQAQPTSSVLGGQNRHTKRRPSKSLLQLQQHLLQQQQQLTQQQQQLSQQQQQQEQPHSCQSNHQYGTILNRGAACFSSTDHACLSIQVSKLQTFQRTTMRASKVCYPYAVLLLSILLGITSIIVYRACLVIHRTFPADLAEVEKIRWLDELGRLALNGHSCFHDWIGMDVGTEPIKTFINTAFSLLFNPLPTQRLVYRSIKASQDVYAGVPVSTYTPVQPPPTGRRKGLHPTIIYFHGGGWTWLSVGVYDGPLKHLANSTQFKVIAVEYRKAPEHPFPAAYTDCLAVTKYVWQHARELHVQQDAILVAGDGAGGNLAAAVANEMAGKVRMQILISPALQMLNLATPSYQDYSEHLMPGITSPAKEINNWIRYGNINPEFKQYMLQNTHVSVQQFNSYVDSQKWLPPSLSNVTRKRTQHNTDYEHLVSKQLAGLIHDSRFSPLFTSDVRNSPQAYVMTAQYDVLRDEALMYGQRLKSNGVTVEFRHYWHGFHGFFLFAGGGWLELAESKKALNDLVTYLNRHILAIAA